MANIQFEEEQGYQPMRPFQRSDKKSFFIRLVLATGIVSTDKAAEYVLLGTAVAVIIFAFLIPVFFGNGPTSPPSPEEIIHTTMPGATQRR